MRLSTANLYDASIANLQRRQNALQDQQQQLTSGKRIALASDDPTWASSCAPTACRARATGSP